MAKSNFEGGAARRIALSNAERKEETSHTRRKAPKGTAHSIELDELTRKQQEERAERERAESAAEMEKIRQAMQASATERASKAATEAFQAAAEKRGPAPLVEKNPAAETKTYFEKIIDAKRVLGQQYAADMWDVQYKKAKDKDAATEAVFAKAEKLRGLDFQSLGIDKAEKIYDEVRALTNDENAKHYVNALAELYKGEANSADIAALNRTYKIPRLANKQEYDPLVGSGGSRMLETHTIGRTSARAELERVSSHLRSAAEARHEHTTKKGQTRTYEAVSGQKGTAVEMTPETVEQWKKDLLIENEELHRKLAEQQAERLSPEKQARIAETSQQISETQARLARMEQYKHLAGELPNEALSLEASVDDLTKKMNALEAQIKKQYGKSPEEIVSMRSFGSFTARFRNWLENIQGHRAILSEWKRLSDEHAEKSQLLEDFRETYKRSPAAGVARIPARKLQETEKIARDFEEIAPKVHVADDFTEQEYESTFLHPDVPNAEKLQRLAEQHADPHEARIFLDQAQQYILAARKGSETAVIGFEGILEKLGIEHEPLVQELMKKAHSELKNAEERAEEARTKGAPKKGAPEKASVVISEGSEDVLPRVEAKAAEEAFKRRVQKEKRAAYELLENLEEELQQLEHDVDKGIISVEDMVNELKGLSRKSGRKELKKDYPELDLGSDGRVVDFHEDVLRMLDEYTDKLERQRHVRKLEEEPKKAERVKETPATREHTEEEKEALAKQAERRKQKLQELRHRKTSDKNTATTARELLARKPKTIAEEAPDTIREEILDVADADVLEGEDAGPETVREETLSVSGKHEKAEPAAEDPRISKVVQSLEELRVADKKEYRAMLDAIRIFARDNDSDARDFLDKQGLRGFDTEELAKIYRNHLFPQPPTKREMQTTSEDLKNLRDHDPKEYKKFLQALKRYVSLVESEEETNEPQPRMTFLNKNKPFLDVLATSLNGWRVADMKRLISELE